MLASCWEMRGSAVAVVMVAAAAAAAALLMLAALGGVEARPLLPMVRAPLAEWGRLHCCCR